MWASISPVGAFGADSRRDFFVCVLLCVAGFKLVCTSSLQGCNRRWITMFRFCFRERFSGKSGVFYAAMVGQHLWLLRSGQKVGRVSTFFVLLSPEQISTVCDQHSGLFVNWSFLVTQIKRK